MGNVIGPFSPEDWFWMLEMKRDIRFMCERDPIRYQYSIKWEKNRLKEYFTREVA